MNFGADLVAALTMIAGAALAFKARKRKFDRTNEYGVERFPSFSAKVKSTSRDFALKAGAYMLMGSGAVLLAYNNVDTWGWIVLLPLAFVLLIIFLGT